MKHRGLTVSTAESCTGGGVAKRITEVSGASAVLRAGGTNFENAVKTACFLTDMSGFSAFNEVYAQYFTGKPARSCIAVKELPKGALVEVEVIAAIQEN